MSTTLPIKGTLESVVLGFDFSAETTAVTSPSVVATIESGVDDTNPSAILVGVPQVDSTNPARILQRVAAGLDGATYRLQCTVQTGGGDTLTLASLLPVRLRL